MKAAESTAGGLRRIPNEKENGKVFRNASAPVCLPAGRHYAHYLSVFFFAALAWDRKRKYTHAFYRRGSSGGLLHQRLSVWSDRISGKRDGFQLSFYGAGADLFHFQPG